MSLYIYAPRIIPGTRELIDALQAKRLVKHDGMRFLYKGVPLEFGPSDAIVCWGAHVPPITNVPCLNTSYNYSNLASLNVRGLPFLASRGYAVFVPSELTSKEYVDSLSTDGSWPNKTPASGFVSIPELEGYGIQHYKFTTVQDILVFRGKAWPAGDTRAHNIAVESLSLLGLDFAVVTVGSATGNSHIVLKLITAPKLDAEGVKLFTKLIGVWQKNTNKSNSIVAEMSKLLE